MADIMSYIDDLIKKGKKPAVAIEARLGSISVSDHSRPCDPEMIKPEIRKALRELKGKEKSSSEIYSHNGVNPVGNCAEVNAAASLLYLCSDIDKIDLFKIEFSSAIRPRTKQSVKRCDNCIGVFGE